MSSLAALKLNNDNSATCVVGEIASSGKLAVTLLERVLLEDSDEASNEVVGTGQNADLGRRLGVELDSSAAVLPVKSVYTEKLSLPFRDKKKLKAIVPLQIQDNLPFDVSGFVIDSSVQHQDTEGNYAILSGLADEESISETLEQLNTVGANPAILTSHASAISQLAKLDSERFSGDFCIVSISSAEMALAIYINGSLRYISEHTAPNSTAQILSELQMAIGHVRSSENERGPFDNVWIIAPDEISSYLIKNSNLNVSNFPLNDYVEGNLDSSSPMHHIAWALGLLVAQNQNSFQKKDEISSDVLNFRQGRFAYKEHWKAVIAALREESDWFILAFCVLIFWVFSITYSSYSRLSQVEDAISTAIGEAMPAVNISKGSELNTIGSKVQELEEQLKGIRSSSSLSALDVLKHISEASDASLDLQVDAISISANAANFRGTVKDIPSVGRLNSVLQKIDKTFCGVKVNSESRIRGRVKISAELPYCTGVRE